MDDKLNKYTVMATTNVFEDEKQNHFEEVQDQYGSLDKAGAING